MYVEFLLLSFFITDNESFERLLFTPFRSMMMMMKFERVDDVRCFCVLCSCLEFSLLRRRTKFCLAKKKEKKFFIVHSKKHFFAPQLKLFFDEKVFKETRTNATLTTTLIKKEKKTER